MHIHDKSAAKAQAVFTTNVSRAEAWRLLTRMFSADTTLGSLVPGSYPLTVVCKAQDREGVGLGDVFRYESARDTHHVGITEWNPEESFAYDEAPLKFWKQPCIVPLERQRMQIRICERDKQLILSVRLTAHFTGLFGFAWNRVFNRNGLAFTVLDSLIGPSSTHASAWAGGWRSLPIRVFTFTPDTFENHDF